MYHQRRFGIAVSILVCYLLQTHGADKYTDENRPYEFGFNVEVDGSKQQHRHEKKDKDGIIMGEFGFITADDVYHVTVYATDKEGRFKILSMKNIHLKSSSASSGSPLSGRQGHSLALPASPSGPPGPAAQAVATPQGTLSQPKTPFKAVSLEPPGRSCSSCSIPTTTRVPPPASFAPQSQQPYFGNSPALPNSVQQGGDGSQPFSPQAESPNYPQQSVGASPGAQTYPQQPGQTAQNYPGLSGGGPKPNPPNNYAPVGPSLTLEQRPSQVGQQGSPQFSSQGTPQDSTQSGLQGGPQGSQQYSKGPNPVQNSSPQSGIPGRTSKQYTGQEQEFNSNLPQPQGQPGPVKPTLVSAQMQIVDRNTDIHALRPGEEHGLPAGLTQNDMTQLLYTFNYTVGFHGHFEEGYRNGAKKGYYFVTGRNGVRTRIDYTADDTGFHPRVSQEVLDLISDDVPKPETEKDAKYGLKGYEFKWLYYPADSKRR